MPLLDMDPCLPSIDALEACMKENNFQSVKCTKILSDFKECCERFQDQSMLCRGYELITVIEISEAMDNKTKQKKSKTNQ